MLPRFSLALVACLPTIVALGAVPDDDLIPPASAIKADRPRLLVRPRTTPFAISLEQLAALPRDADFQRMLAQLQAQDHAAAQAMVWLLTKDASAADRAVRRMRNYRYPGEVDTFHIFGYLTEFGLAYDWLYGYPGFTSAIKAEVRANLAPLADQAIQVTNDHMFHNYIWMSAGGVALWAMATTGEDAAADRLFEQVRQRFNHGLYPAWRYLDGLPSEPMGYWALYVFTPGVWTLLAAQSAFETDLVGTVRTQHGDWFDRNFENLIHSTLPNMRYIPWGDLQGGPNGSVTHEMAGVIDGAIWALRSPQGKAHENGTGTDRPDRSQSHFSSQGARFSSWLQDKRGLERFYGETAIFYMLYARQPQVDPADPPLSLLAGNRHSGHFIARSGWDDGATVVAFRCTDHFGDHHHYDQGSFMIWRNGLLAVDPPVYRKVRGPQQLTEHHNTLLLDDRPQRPVRGQSFVTIEDFEKNLQAGRKLETGDILYSHDAGSWAAVAGQFAQAYDEGLLESCVRQLLFVRPDKVIVVDRLRAGTGKPLPRVQWLLQLPREPSQQERGLVASNGTSWIRCRAILPADGSLPTISATPVNTQRASFEYRGQAELALVHVLDVGDGTVAGLPPAVTARQTGQDVQVVVDGSTFVFAGSGEHRVTCGR